MGSRVSSPRLVGRASELARLRDAFDQATDGRPRLVLISGDAGVGKSRLVAELLARLQPHEARILAGGCLAISGGGLPYAPLTEALRQLARQLDPATLETVLGPARTELARLLPDLAGDAGRDGSPGGASDGGSSSRAEQARLFELILGLLGRLAQALPLILVIEDLQWADDATRDLLVFLARNLGPERVMVVATTRSEADGLDAATAAWVAELARSPIAERIDLPPLAPDEIADQVAGILGSPAPPALIEAVVSRSGGNALFVEELVAGRDDPASGAGLDRAPGRIPRTLRDTLVTRTRGLSPETMTILRVLAVAGREVDDRLVVAATGLAAPAVHAAIHDAIDRHLVVSDPGEAVVVLRHALLGEAIVGELLAGERRQLHADLAGALVRHPELADRSPAGAAGELAYHWAEADDPVQAFPAARAAAEAATAVHAHAEASRQRRRAVELHERLPASARVPPPDRIELLLEFEESASLAGDLDLAVDAVERAISLVDPIADPVRAGILESRLGYHRWLAGRSDEALAHHRRAVELVPTEPPSLARARVVRGLGGALMGIGHYRESAAVCEEAIAAARAADAPIEEGRALDMLGMDRVGLGDVDGGITALEAACDLARRHDPAEGLIVGLYNLAYHLGLADRPDAALAAAREGIEVAATVGLERRFGATLRTVAADILLGLGRWAEAEELVEAALGLAPAAAGSLYLTIVRIRLATARGAFPAAESALEEALQAAGEDVDFDLLAYLRTAEAELRLWEGRPDAALAAARAGLSTLDGRDDRFLGPPLVARGLWAVADLTAAASAWGDEPGRAAAMASAADLERRLPSAASDGPAASEEPPSTAGRRAAIAWARAEAGRARGSSDRSAWSEVADAWTSLSQPAMAGYARYRAAEALLAARSRSPRAAAADRASATAELQAVSRAATTLGARPLSEAVAGLARRARIDLVPTEPAPSAAAATPVGGPLDGRRHLRERGLSDREIEVLALVASGRTNGEIARALFISPKTASVHVTHILAKLGAANRVEAAAVASRLGLIDEPRLAAITRPEPRRAGVAEPTAERTFLFTDIVASTALLDAIGDPAWSDLRAWHDATLRRLFEAHGGVEVDHAGDGFFVAFPTAGPAIACALAIQQALADHRRTSGFAPGVRLGVHTGTATRSGAGWTGRDVHLAARLMDLAGPGEVVASEAALERAGMRPPAEPTEVELPGISGRIRVVRLAGVPV